MPYSPPTLIKLIIHHYIQPQTLHRCSSVQPTLKHFPYKLPGLPIRNMACETATERPKGDGESPSKTVKREMAVEEMEEQAAPTAKKLKQEGESKDGECLRRGQRCAICVPTGG